MDRRTVLISATLLLSVLKIDVAATLPERSIDSAEGQTQIDTALRKWEAKTNGIKTFHCYFTALHFSRDAGSASRSSEQTEEPFMISKGQIWFEAPNRTTILHDDAWGRQRNSKTSKVETSRIDDHSHWIIDGKSVYIVADKEKQVHKLKLAPDGMIPMSSGKDSRHFRPLELLIPPYGFRMTIDAADLHERYDIRNPAGTTWLELIPREKETLHSAVRIVIGADDVPISTETIDRTGGTELRTLVLFDRLEFNPEKPFPPDVFSSRRDGYKLIEH